ncbi:MAG: UDP-4-amino-4,6-dideoxy-N-acetyl-beta-L-altrosamine transaminase [Caulobacterales bacterium]|uniref:UDP-4-amino-4, 6-dideoxy-N-acetyl-beta-L-altrosamine transaminase n=1 Tax=Glycocaulis sp. TaxID=1969725 RepID=UPI003FA0445B
MAQAGEFLAYGRQDIDADDIAAVVRALQSDFLTTGPEIDAFETEFARWTVAGHAIACSNGTTALHLALEALGVGEGDVCIVPSITFMATANAARYCGAEVQFADVDPDTGLLTAETLEAALERTGDRAKAVLPVHLAGVPCDMESIASIARKAGLKIVEDSCHAIGSLYPDGSMVGACRLGDAATFSFHPVKSLTTGEGGMITTESAELASRMARMRSHGIERDSSRFVREEGAHEPWYHEMPALGWNYRLPDINAALGRAQLARMGEFAARRRALVSAYRKGLAPLAPLVRLPDDPAGSDPCRHLMNVLIDFDAAGISRPSLMHALKARGIGTQVHYIPVHTQPYYVRRYGRMNLPGAQAHYARTLSLPLFTRMDEADVMRVCDELGAALRA